MDTLADVVARDRRSDAPALLAGDRTMDYRRALTTAWKASNYLRHLGVAGERGVVVVADASPPPVLTFLGAALLDVPTRFVDDTADAADAVAETDARALVVPVAEETAVDPPAGTSLVVHGGDPAAATTEHWEAGVWSENPAFVPSAATPATTALLTAEGGVSHGALLAAADRAVDRLALDGDAVVGLRASLADPRAVAAGVVAPLSVGAGVRLGPGENSVTVGPAGGDADLPVDAVALGD